MRNQIRVPSTIQNAQAIAAAMDLKIENSTASAPDGKLGQLARPH